MLVEKLKNTLRSILLAVCSLCLMSFTVVIDAGHGGKDPGAVGKTGQEKEINLNVALAVGKLITEKYPDVKIIDMGVGEPDRKADESIVSGLAGVFHVVPIADFYCLHGHSPDISVPNVQSSFQPFFC